MQGLVTLIGAVDSSGKAYTTQQLIDLKLVTPVAFTGRGWGLAKHEVVMGFNIWTRASRQYRAYLFGNKSPLSSYVCSRFGIGTGTRAPAITDTDLESPLAFYQPGGVGPILYTKPVDSIDFPAPFIARVTFTIAAGEANGGDGNGTLLTEFGLYAQDSDSGANVLLNRKTSAAGLPKSSDFSPTLNWRLRV